MKKQYIIIAAIVAGIAIASGFIITNLQNDYKTTAQTEHIFVPNLAQKINRLHEITFAFNSPTAKPIGTTLKKVEDNNWIVKNKNYPADWAKLSKLLLSLSKSRFIEEKTNQPSRFNKLGLDADAALSLSLITKDKASIAFNLGKYSKTLNGTYVKLAEQDAAWLVSGNLDADQYKIDWLDKKPFSIPQSQVKQFSLKNAKKTQTLLELSKQTPQQQAFNASFNGKTIETQDLKENLPYTLSAIWQDFSIIDVQPAADLVKPVKEESITLTTFTGLSVQAQLLKAKNGYWVAFSADKQTANPDINDTNIDAQIAQINAYKPWVYRLNRFKTSLFKQKRADILLP